MPRAALGVACLLAVTVPALATGVPLLGSTPVGSWARYEYRSQSSRGGVEQWHQTFSRLPDRDGLVVLELFVEQQRAGRPPMVIQMHADRALLSETSLGAFDQHIREAVLQTGSGPAVVQSWEDVRKQIGGGVFRMFDYAREVQQLGEQVVAGHRCRKQRAEGQVQVKALGGTLEYAYTAELCVSGELPFGRVSERGETRETQGFDSSRTEALLVEHGLEGARSRLKGRPISKQEAAAGK